MLGVSALAVASTLSITAIAAEWRGWNIHKPGYPNTVAMDKFAELLKQKTGGEILSFSPLLRFHCRGPHGETGDPRGRRN